MTQESANSCISNSSSRCQHRFVNGTRCRLPLSDSDLFFCARHAGLPEHQHASADLTATLTSGLTEFKSAIPINDFLSRLLLLEAQDRIPPRRAAVMAYTCNLLLRTLPAIDRELHPELEDDTVTIDFGDLPRPQRDRPTPEPKIFTGIPGVTPMPEKKSS